MKKKREIVSYLGVTKKIKKSEKSTWLCHFLFVSSYMIKERITNKKEKRDKGLGDRRLFVMNVFTGG